jgi:Ran GTPase-activating protein (RanGAP) involved in mRNA processing and transport
LETTELGDEGSAHFIEAITGRTFALRNLYLNANGIGQKVCSSIAKYLADSHCQLESLFLSTNPIGDAGMLLLASGLAKNNTLKRFTCASSGLTGKGVLYLAAALCDGERPLQSLDLSASQTTIAHNQIYTIGLMMTVLNP